MKWKGNREWRLDKGLSDDVMNYFRILSWQSPRYRTTRSAVKLQQLASWIHVQIFTTTPTCSFWWCWTFTYRFLFRYSHSNQPWTYRHFRKCICKSYPVGSKLVCNISQTLGSSGIENWAANSKLLSSCIPAGLRSTVTSMKNDLWKYCFTVSTKHIKPGVHHVPN